MRTKAQLDIRKFRIKDAISVFIDTTLQYGTMEISIGTIIYFLIGEVLKGVIVPIVEPIVQRVFEQFIPPKLGLQGQNQQTDAQPFQEVMQKTEENFIETNDSPTSHSPAAGKNNYSIHQNPQNGLYQLQPHAVQTAPKKVEIHTVQECRPGVLHVSWNETKSDYYELQYDGQTGNSKKVSSTECLLDSMQLNFPSTMFYSIRVRAVNGCGPGDWSETMTGPFTILPEQPQKPLTVHVNSSSCVSLLVEKPTEREGSKPVTEFVVQYHTHESTKWTKDIFPVEKLQTISIKKRNALKIDLKWNIDITPAYHVQISHRNEDGDSLPRECTIKTKKIPPGEPVEPSAVFRNTDTIIIKWKVPDINAYAVDHYEVQWEVNEHTMETKTTKGCYIVIRSLKPGKRYSFKVSTVNKWSCGSEITEISAETESTTKKAAWVFGVSIAGAFLASLASVVSITMLFIGMVIFKIARKQTTCLEVTKRWGVLIAATFIGIAAGAVVHPLLPTPVGAGVHALFAIAVAGAGIAIGVLRKSNEKDLEKHLRLCQDGQITNQQPQARQECLKRLWSLIDSHLLFSFFIFISVFPVFHCFYETYYFLSSGRFSPIIEYIYNNTFILLETYFGEV